MEKVQKLTDQLETGITELFNSEQYAAYLSTMSKFHRYSFGNILLILLQCPGASQVAGYGDWKKNFGRQVKRGERGITILAPCPYRRREEVEETAPDGSTATTIQLVQRVGFRTVTVFDVSQTEGKPLSELVHKLTGDVADYERMTEAICALSPYPINIEAFPGAAYGCCNFVEQRILVQPDMSQVQTIKTMIHEVSHAKLHAPIEDGDGETPPQRKRRFVREMEAESVAYVVCQHFGIDTADYSFGYVAGWSHGKNLSQLKASLELIRNTSNRWTVSEYGNHEMSNMVYRFSWREYERTEWDRTLKKSVPKSWELTWSVTFNTPHNPDYSGDGWKIAGQDRKVFRDRASMEKYLQGRIAAYADLFVEICPPIPAEHKSRFSINGQLMRDYTVATKEPERPDQGQVDALLDCLDDADMLEVPTLAPKKQHPQKEKHTIKKKHSPTR